MKFPAVAVVALLTAYEIPAVAQSIGAIEVGSKTCREGMFEHLTFKDPESARVGKVTGGKMEVIEFSGTKIAARRFDVPVNAKNALGGYVGEKTVVCFTSEDGQRILKVDLLPF
jgi:hypothetical protein